MTVYQASKRAGEKDVERSETTGDREREREKGTTKGYVETEEKQIQRLIKRAHSLGRDDRCNVIKYNDCLPAIFGVCQV